MPRNPETRRAYESTPKYKAWKKIADAKPARKEKRRKYCRTWVARKRGHTPIDEATVTPRPENGKCTLCEHERDLVPDHDHITGRFRGWLCRTCNLTLGRLGDSIEGLERALAYLRGTKMTRTETTNADHS